MAPALGNNESPKEEMNTVEHHSIDNISLNIMKENIQLHTSPPISPIKPSLLNKFQNINPVELGIKTFCVTGFIIGLLVARLGVPDNEVQCVQDKLVDALEHANKFINTPGNEFFRDLFQIICSLFVDTAFFTTMGYWILYSTSIRLPVTLGVFYGVRALVQAVWFSPFPEGFYWYSPGFPSLVVPYGRGSDFFFSGHAGFMMICTMEWHKSGVKKMRNVLWLMTIYTFIILLVYRIHYSIDVFTGAIFAEWAFWKVDHYLKPVDKLWRMLLEILSYKLRAKEVDASEVLHKVSVSSDRQK